MLGIGLFVYPVVSNYIFELNASTATQNYDNTVRELNKENLKVQRQRAVVYNENLEGNPAHDPFLEGSGAVLDPEYANILKIDEQGTMGYITIPKIGVQLSILHGTSNNVLQKNVGHFEGSSLPVGGKTTHSVLTGHSGLAHARIFTDLIKLETGDIFYLHVLDQTLAYQVDQIKTVLPDETEELRRFENEDYCTLVTCTPYGVNTHRLFVRGTRIEYIPEVEQELIANSAPSFGWFTGWNVMMGIAVGVGYLVVFAIVLLLRRRKKKNRMNGGLTWQTTAGGTSKRRKVKREKPRWWDDAAGV